MIEVEKLKVLYGEVEEVTVPSQSGAVQTLTRCPKCHFAVWSVYLALGLRAETLRSIDVGTLDNPNLCSPTFHIYTRFKKLCITLSDDIPAFEDLYDATKYWTKEQQDRRKQALYVRSYFML
jgi:hypothetical protein